MPIYAYKCSACGHAQDVLQKMSDPRLTVCPECGQSTYVKQVTAAGFQLKGSGWYVTDFRDNGSKPSQDKKSASPDSTPESAPSGSSGNAASSEASGGKSPAKAETPAAPAAKPAANSTPSASTS